MFYITKVVLKKKNKLVLTPVVRSNFCYML